jgi:catechol 2,3-dioxygenase-like lactoylglutathione lyase family enzyme
VSGRHEVRWCFHTTAMVADYARTRDALIRLVGCRVLEDDRVEDPAVGRRGGMTWIGDNSLELGEPIVPGGSADRFVERFGSHMSSIAVQVADIDATVAFLESQGARIAARAEGAIVFTHPADTAGVVVEWYGGRPPNDPRFGTPIPELAMPPVLDVTHMAFGGAVVEDPPAAASRLASLMDTGVTFIEPFAPPGAPEAGVSLGDMTLALYRLPPSPDASSALWGHEYRRPQTSSLGVSVPDLGAARAALAEAGVPVVRSDDRCVVVDPSATGGVSLVVVDSLLPGDPRGPHHDATVS